MTIPKEDVYYGVSCYSCGRKRPLRGVIYCPPCYAKWVRR